MLTLIAMDTTSRQPREPQTSTAHEEVDTNEPINNQQEAAGSYRQLASGPSGLPPLTSNQTTVTPVCLFVY